MMVLTGRQQQILDASMQVIEQDGLRGFTMRNIAQRIGFTDAALYRHFPDKGAILQALASHFQMITLENLEKIRLTPGVNALQRLQLFLKGRAMEFEGNRRMTSMLFSEELFRSDGEALNLNRITRVARAYQLEQMVLEGQLEGSIRADLPAQHLVLLLMGSMRLMVSTWKTLLDPPSEGDQPSLVTTVEAFWKTFEILTRDTSKKTAP